jgi:thioredoxin reductase
MAPRPTEAAFFSDSESEDEKPNADPTGWPPAATTALVPAGGPAHPWEAVQVSLQQQVAETLPVAQANSGPTHPYVELGAKKREPDAYMERIERMKPNADHSELRSKVADIFAGPQSFSTRSITLLTEDNSQSMTVSATVSTTVKEIKDLVAAITKQDVRDLRVMSKKGSYWREENHFGEVSSKVMIKGVKSFSAAEHRFQHPVVIVGGGFGGASLAIEMLRNKREDFVIFERLHDFGGRSWLVVANKHTKLQTEKGTYHINYPYHDFPCPNYMPVWPSRDQIVHMFQKESRSYGLENKTMFNTEVRSVTTVGKSDSWSRCFQVEYALKDSEGKGDTFTAGAVAAWPGNLSLPSDISFPGESNFHGYIEHGSCSKADYTKCQEKIVILYGHGAFTIENVRTLVEHLATKIWIVCRKRNLTAPKILSWIISQTAIPATGVQTLRVWEVMYKATTDWDPWTCHSVQADPGRTQARIKQDTVFGVTDVYFLALYYGKAEIVCDEIKKLSHHTAHLKKGRALECEVIIKVIGIHGDFEIDKQLSIKELRGFWVNGDVFRPCISNGNGVNAQNFGTFSVGPGILHNVCLMYHFLTNPADYFNVAEFLPVRVADKNPCYAYRGDHAMSVGVLCGTYCPALAAKQQYFDQMKSYKQHVAHPLEEYLEECKQEWEMYCDMIDMPEVARPPYPYTKEMILGFIDAFNDTTRFEEKARKRAEYDAKGEAIQDQ